MAKLTPIYKNILSALLIALLVGSPYAASAKSKKSKAVTQSALNLDFNDSQTAAEAQIKEKSELDLYTEDSFLDAEFAKAEVKVKRKKQDLTIATVSSTPEEVLLEQTFETPVKTTKAVAVKAIETAKPTEAKKQSNVVAKKTPVAKPAAVVVAPVAIPVVTTQSTALPTSLSGSSNTSMEEITAPAKKKKKLSLGLSVSKSNSLFNYNDGSEMSSLDFSFTAGYKLTSIYKLSAALDASEDLKNGENSGIVSGRLGLSHKEIETTDWLEITPSLSVRLPVNKDQTSRESFLFGVTTSAAFDIKPEYLFSENLSVGASVSLGKNFHEYSTSTTGDVNAEYSSIQGLNLGYAFNDELSLSAGFSHVNRLSYEGSLSESFEISQELDYTYSENITAMIGHVNGGSVFKADGESSNITPYDENNSVVYGGLSLTY